jgi:signal transduction histidine kinase
VSHDPDAADAPSAASTLSRELEATREDLLRVRRERDRLLEEQRRAQRDQVTFLALVAHQLKAPLLPLDVSLLAIQRAIERGRELPSDTIARARRQSGRLARLIEALLVDLPHAEEGTLSAKLEVIDVLRIVRGCVDELESLVASRRFELSLPEPPVRVFADAGRVAQIAMNLLDNAVKYSPPGSTIAVRVDVDSECRVSVMDHGIGIPPEELAHLFSRFHRASNAPAHLYRGLGIGLFLSQKLAELCHGRVTVESQVGRGTQATLTLPLARA